MSHGAGAAKGTGGTVVGGVAPRVKPNFRVVTGFQSGQLVLLRNQIAAFKKIKKGEFDFHFPGTRHATGAQQQV
jgi:hypothetical protein